MAQPAPAITIGELESKIRDMVNHPRLRHAFARQMGTWNILCSSLDVIGDTDLAIGSFRVLDEPEDVGLRYLYLYGILQVLFVQHDAARNILTVLGVRNPDPPELLYVREVRNRATGHPTRREGKPKKGIPQTSHFISRISLSATLGFKLLSCDEHGNNCFEDVDLADLLAKHSSGVQDLLKSAYTELRARETEHRLKFKDTKLAGIFAGDMSYPIEKIFEACHGTRDRREFGLLNVRFLQERMDKFILAAEDRGVLPAYDELAFTIKEVSYPLEELRKYFECDPTSSLNAESSYIFAFFIKHHYPRLVDAARQIDEEYSEEVAE